LIIENRSFIEHRSIDPLKIKTSYLLNCQKQAPTIVVGILLNAQQNDFGCDRFRAGFVRAGTLYQCSLCERIERFLSRFDTTSANPPPIKAEGWEALDIVHGAEQRLFGY
jgi:hypothetical protein